ncbi:MAG: hypothetical protein AAFY56_14195, partial [Pseudomonadota bacterium]
SKEVRDLIKAPKKRMDKLQPAKYYRKEYQKCHRYFKRVQTQQLAVDRMQAVRQNEPNNGWEFKTIGPFARQGTPEREIFDRLPQSLQDSLQRGNGVFRDQDTGNNVRLLYDRANNEVVMSFNGTSGGLHNAVAGNKGIVRAQNRTNVSNYMGGTPPSVKQAVAIGKAVRGAVDDYNQTQPPTQKLDVVSTGHSRGGLLATVEAVKNHGKAVTFNPEPMGAGVRDYCDLYSSNVVHEDVDVTNYSVKNEYVSGSGIMSGVGNTLETVGGFLPLGPLTNPPIIFGKRRILPQAPSSVAAHPDPVMHMSYLAAGGQPPDKASWRSGSEVNDPTLYQAEVGPDIAAGAIDRYRDAYKAELDDYINDRSKVDDYLNTMSDYYAQNLDRNTMLSKLRNSKTKADNIDMTDYMKQRTAKELAQFTLHSAIQQSQT